MPLELVLLDWTKSNFSQMRGALLLAWRSFLRLQSKMRNNFYEPLFVWKFNQWVADGLIKDTPENKAHQWVAPQFPWVDELAEANAIEKKIALGLMSYDEACKSLEREYQKTLDKQKSETINAIRVAKEIEAETGVLPPWQPFAGKAVGQTAQAEIEKQKAEPTPEPAPANNAEGNADADPE